MFGLLRRRGALRTRPDPQVPNGMNGPQRTTADGRAVSLANQQELREDVSRLYAMISELKEQVEKTDANSMPSVSTAEKARREKRAKQVEDLAQGRSSISFVFIGNRMNASSSAGKTSSTCFSLTSLYMRKKVVLA